MAAHHRLSQVESASTIVTMAYDPIGPRNSKYQRLNDPVHTGRRLRVLDDLVHPDDQHKLAFTFGNQQYTFIRCPFDYANSPAEFKIFLNKACPDAKGPKIALHKGQWCKTKVNYVGLLVGRNGIEPQSNHTQAIQSKTPTNISELQSFLGVYNYSRHFIENR